MSEDWKVYENMEDFKEYFCDWIDSIVEEGYKDDSRILAMKRDGSIFFNFGILSSDTPITIQFKTSSLKLKI